MKAQSKLIISAIMVVLALVIATQSMFVVRPDQFAIVTEFGDPVDPEGIKEPGLYFKMPFIQEVIYLDRRVHGWDDEGKDVKTKELKPIDFVAFARWRIADPLRYYEAVRDVTRAAASMDSVVTARIQAKVREKKLGELVRNDKKNCDKSTPPKCSTRDFTAQEKLDLQNLIERFEECNPDPLCVQGSPDDLVCKLAGGCVPERCTPACEANQVCVPGNAEIRAQLEEKKSQRINLDAAPQRSDIVASILSESNAVLRAEFGIEILDLHFKYLNLSPAVHEDVIRRIRADREADIATYRRVGKACRGAILQGKEQRLGDINGERDRRVRLEEGIAVAEAIDIKQAAFSEDPEFFRFAKTLEVYEKSLRDGTRLVLSADSPILALMKDASLLAPIGTAPTPSLVPDPTKRPQMLPQPRKPAPIPAPKAPEPAPEAPEAPEPE